MQSKSHFCSIICFPEIRLGEIVFGNWRFLAQFQEKSAISGQHIDNKIHVLLKVITSDILILEVIFVWMISEK